MNEGYWQSCIGRLLAGGEDVFEGGEEAGYLLMLESPNSYYTDLEKRRKNKWKMVTASSEFDFESHSEENQRIVCSQLELYEHLCMDLHKDAIKGIGEARDPAQLADLEEQFFEETKK
jgi:hypothetical protein